MQKVEFPVQSFCDRFPKAMQWKCFFFTLCYTHALALSFISIILRRDQSRTQSFSVNFNTYYCLTSFA